MTTTNNKWDDEQYAETRWWGTGMMNWQGKGSKVGYGQQAETGTTTERAKRTLSSVNVTQKCIKSTRSSRASTSTHPPQMPHKLLIQWMHAYRIRMEGKYQGSGWGARDKCVSSPWYVLSFFLFLPLLTIRTRGRRYGTERKRVIMHTELEWRRPGEW